MPTLSGDVPSFPDAMCARAPCAGAWRVQRCACVHARCSQNGLSDPYVKLTLRGVTKRSKVIAKTLTPVWAQEFVFRGTRQALASEPLQLVAYDHDAYSLNDQRRVLPRGLLIT